MHHHRPAGRILALSAFFASLPCLDARAQFTSYGRSCGLTLSGVQRLGDPTRHLDLEMKGAGPARIFALTIGAQRANGTLPGGCPLHHVPFVVLPYVSTLRGDAKMSFAVPASFAIGRSTFQAAELDTSRMSWRTSNGLELAALRAIATLDEQFSTRSQIDPDLEGARWVSGAVSEAELGGTGLLGEFRATDGRKFNAVDAQGRDIYEFDIDRIAVPASRTLDGRARVVTNGVLEYASFIVAKNEHVRFVGSKPVSLRVAGVVRVDGAVDLYAPRQTLGSRARTAQLGRLGGANGGAGAYFAQSGALVKAENGRDIVLPRGHPRGVAAVGTGGQASISNPATGKPADIPWITVSSFNVFVRAKAAGGGGGGFWNAGSNWVPTGGQVVQTPSASYPILGRYKNSEFGPPSKPGADFPVLPLVSLRSSYDTFLIGGSGGGGAGADASFSPAPTLVSWSEGGGGAAGGGALSIQCGGAFSADGIVRARGSAGHQIVNSTTSPPASSPGGAGSGASILVQSARTAKGTLDVRGGERGRFWEGLSLIEIEALSGRGGAGYARIEAPTRPKVADFVGSTPPVTTDNTAVLRSLDHGEASGVGSKYYVLNRKRDLHLWSYTIDAVVDNTPVTYSDAPSSTRRADEGEAVVASFQRAFVDASGKVSNATRWSMGAIAPLNAASGDANAVRFFLRLDTKVTTSKRVRIVRVRIRHD